MIEYNAVYQMWLMQKRIREHGATERTADLFNISETETRHIVYAISRWRARQVLRKARANNYYWRGSK